MRTTRTTRRLLAIPMVPLALFLGACGSGNGGSARPAGVGGESGASSTSTTAADEPTAATVVTVDIEDFAFSPARLEIQRGTQVTWTNKDEFLHTVTSGATDGPENIPDGMFDQGMAEEGRTASVTFSDAGTFTYYCKQHNAMDGTITVS